MSFRLTWRGQSWTDADVLVMDLVTVQILLGGEWSNFDPWSGPTQALALVAALVARTSGRSLAEVVDEVRAAPAAELLNALEPREDG